MAIQGPEVEVTENQEMLKVAAEFSKNLFGFESNLDFHLGEDFWREEDKVSTAENTLLEAPFTEEEIKEAIFGSYANGAPGPDGFPFLFYQKFWKVIKDDFMNMVRAFEKDELNLERLNYVMLTLILSRRN